MSLSPNEMLRALETVQRCKAARARAIAEQEKAERAALGEGFRAPYCIHGYSHWTDNDVPCMYCEEFGYNGLPNMVTVYAYAIREAKQHAEKIHRAIKATCALSDLGISPQIIRYLSREIQRIVCTPAPASVY